MHIMKLQEKYFNYIKFGTKEFEIRLNDEKRKKIKKGDLIEFQKEPLLEEKIIYEVDDLFCFTNFEELINEFDIKYLADNDESSETLLKSLNSFYSDEDQKKYGVVAIKLNKNYNFTVEKNYISTIKSIDEVFRNIKSNYSNFDEWYLKLININEECYFTKKDNKVTSILILKINESDSQQIDKKNVLKIRTLNVLEINEGIGSFYLKIVDDIAIKNNINLIYVTCKNNNEKFIKFIKNNKFRLYKELDDEQVYIKEI